MPITPELDPFAGFTTATLTTSLVPEGTAVTAWSCTTCGCLVGDRAAHQRVMCSLRIEEIAKTRVISAPTDPEVDKLYATGSGGYLATVELPEANPVYTENYVGDPPMYYCGTQGAPLTADVEQLLQNAADLIALARRIQADQ